jgi:hypothetical protein
MTGIGMFLHINNQQDEKGQERTTARTRREDHLLESLTTKSRVLTFLKAICP